MNRNISFSCMFYVFLMIMIVFGAGPVFAATQPEFESTHAAAKVEELLLQLERAFVDEQWDLVLNILEVLPQPEYSELIERFHDALPHESLQLISRGPISLDEERTLAEEAADEHEYRKTRYEETRLLQDVPSGDPELEQTLIIPSPQREGTSTKAILGVGPSCTYGTIQAAVNAAISGDDIYIAGGAYYETVNINDKSLTIYGGANSTCSSITGGLSIIDGAGCSSDSVFEIYGETTYNIVRLNNLHIINGEYDSNGGGGIEIDDSTSVFLVNTLVYQNFSGYGGGVHMTGMAANLILDADSSIHNNEALQDGGGIYCENGDVWIFSGENYVGKAGLGNVADSDSNGTGNGGGVYLDSGKLFVHGFSDVGRISYNEANNGGGVYALNSSKIYVEGVDAGILHNIATSSGGGLYLGSDSDLYLTAGAVNYNTAGNYGGGLFATGSGTTADFDIITACGGKCAQLSYNTATSGFGGGAYVRLGALLDLEMVYMENNSAGNLGSAIFGYASGTIIELDHVMLNDNTAGSEYVIRLLGSGGGPKVNIRNSTIGGNGQKHYIFGVDTDCTFNGFGLIVWGNSGTALFDSAGTVSLDSSILQYSYTGTDNIVADPLFLDAAAGNYHISKNSPAVDYCSGYGAYDVDWESRPHDVIGVGSKGEESKAGLYDAGADEVYAYIGVGGAVCEHGTIADAVAVATPGDTIYIPAGLYLERIGTISKDLTSWQPMINALQSTRLVAVQPLLSIMTAASRP